MYRRECMIAKTRENCSNAEDQRPNNKNGASHPRAGKLLNEEKLCEPISDEIDEQKNCAGATHPVNAISQREYQHTIEQAGDIKQSAGVGLRMDQRCYGEGDTQNTDKHGPAGSLADRPLSNCLRISLLGRTLMLQKG